MTETRNPPMRFWPFAKHALFIFPEMFHSEREYKYIYITLTWIGCCPMATFSGSGTRTRVTLSGREAPILNSRTVTYLQEFLRRRCVFGISRSALKLPHAQCTLFESVISAFECSMPSMLCNELSKNCYNICPRKPVDETGLVI